MELGRGTFDADTGAASAARVLSLVGGRVRPAAGGDLPAIELRTTDGASWLAQPLGCYPGEYGEDEQYMAAYSWQQLTAALIGGSWPPDAEPEPDEYGFEPDEDMEVPE